MGGTLTPPCFVIGHRSHAPPLNLCDRSSGFLTHDLFLSPDTRLATSRSLRRQLVTEIFSWGTTLPGSKIENPYFAFIPNLAATLPADGSDVEFSSPCFTKMKARVEGVGTSDVKVVLNAAGRSSAFCSDFYLLATTSTFHLEHVMLGGDHSIAFNLPADATDSEKWCVGRRWSTLPSSAWLYLLISRCR